MFFTDLFARYREMGAMGQPPPFDEHAFSFNGAANAWTHSINRNSNDRSSSSGDEEIEERFSSPHGLRLNLRLLKNNNICKDYYTLTSNVLRSLMMGIKEMASEKITPAWQVEFRCPSPKKSISSLFVNKLNEEGVYPKLTTIHGNGEMGMSKLSFLSHPMHQPMREAMNITNLRRCLWNQIGHPVSYLISISPVMENSLEESSAERVMETSMYVQEPATSQEAQLVDREDSSCEISHQGLEQVTRTSSPEDQILEEGNAMDSVTITPDTPRITDIKAEDEITTDGDSSQTTPANTKEDHDAKPSTDSESENEPLIRRSRPINQTASGNKQFASSLQSREDKENPRRNHDVSSKSTSSKNNGLRNKAGEVGWQVSCSRHREVERHVSCSSSRLACRQTMVTSNNKTIMPPRPKSWCLVGGYVKRFPTKHHHHTSPKIKPLSKNQPQVPLAA